MRWLCLWFSGSAVLSVASRDTKDGFLLLQDLFGQRFGASPGELVSDPCNNLDGGSVEDGIVLDEPALHLFG